MNSEPLSDLPSNKRDGWRVIDAAIKTLNAFQLLLCNQAISKQAMPTVRFYLTTTCIEIAQWECYMVILENDHYDVFISDNVLLNAF